MDSTDLRFTICFNRSIKIKERYELIDNDVLSKVALITVDGIMEQPDHDATEPRNDGLYATIIICTGCHSSIDFFKFGGSSEICVNTSKDHFDDMLTILGRASD